ncbi:hypothetical protein ABK040_012760 [Willaertia magna]
MISESGDDNKNLSSPFSFRRRSSSPNTSSPSSSSNNNNTSNTPNTPRNNNRKFSTPNTPKSPSSPSTMTMSTSIFNNITDNSIVTDNDQMIDSSNDVTLELPTFTPSKKRKSKRLIKKKQHHSTLYNNNIIFTNSEKRITIAGNSIFPNSENIIYLHDNENDNSFNNKLKLQQQIHIWLPNEVLIKIFLYLPIENMSKVCLVCKHWYFTTIDDLLWFEIFQLNYPNELLEIRSHSLTSICQQSNNINSNNNNNGNNNNRTSNFGSSSPSSFLNTKNHINYYRNSYNNNNNLSYRSLFIERYVNDLILLKTGSFEVNENKISFKKAPWSKEDYLYVHQMEMYTYYNGNNKIVNHATPVKIVVVGDGAVGKTSLLNRFANDEFLTDEYLPTIFDNYTTFTIYDNKRWAVSFIDTAGSEDYDQLRPLSYIGADIFLLCFDSVNAISLKNCTNRWIVELSKHAPNIPIFLCATKLDLRINKSNSKESLKFNLDKKYKRYGVVTFKEGLEVCKKINNCVGYAETSAKTGQGVKNCMEMVMKWGCKYAMIQRTYYEKNKNCIIG